MNDSKSLHNKIAKHIVELPKSGIREFFELVIGVEDVISLGVGEPDFVTPWTIRENAIYSLERGHTSYTSNKGLLDLRKAVCEYVASDYGVEYSPENECLITVGVSEALDLL
jgi:aminotransferase